ncbi:hypothetical protein HQQ88_11115 [Curtobacterium sp. VKM Ac-2861]|uniref:hypothetical protein n=1 Tax=Curtobacterium sp. VKM Ac-2861 TaxID=2739016 RepID=UPI0015631656|nr:hypothetical protein [Curtobacterium sp. VKM Ac-2861]
MNDMDDLVKSLNELRNTLTAFDATTFWSNLAATFFGAILAGAVAFFVFRFERNDRYSDRLTEALADSFLSITQYMKDLRVGTIIEPLEQLTALRRARLRADEKDRPVIVAAEAAIWASGKAPTGYQSCGRIVLMLTRWQTGTRTADEVISALRTLPLNATEASLDPESW